MQTSLNKLTYLESALKETGFGFEIKRYLWGELAKLYYSQKLYEKAARAQANRASMEITVKDRVESYLLAAEYFAKLGKIETCEDVFIRAGRDAKGYEEKIKVARRNLFLNCAKEMEDTGKRAGAVKFYERLLKMDLDVVEKATIKDKLVKAYNALGMFREARMLDGGK